MFKKFRINTGWVFTIATGIMLICPGLVQDGMFMDGQQYACVAKQLADGNGVFWFPHLSATWSKAGSSFFMEHPPLVYGIQSFYFYVFGSSLYTERIYDFSILILSTILILQIWVSIFRENEALKKMSWLPVLLWLIIPVNFWAFQHNIHELTLSFFALGAVLGWIKHIQSNKIWSWYLFISVGCLLGSFLCKGIVGLFPIIVGCLYAILQLESWKRLMISSLIYVVLFFVVVMLLLLDQQAYESLSYYFKERLWYRVNEEPVVNNRWIIIGQLALNLAPLILLAAISYRYIKIKKLNWKYPEMQWFILIGLSASVPLILTHVQRNFYLVPSLPYFAMSCALLTVPLVHYFNKKPWEKLKKIVGAVSLCFLLIALAVTAFSIGKTKRDHLLLQDVYQIGQIVPENSVVEVSKTLVENWPLQMYLIRYFNIALTSSTEEADFYLTEKSVSFKNDKKLINDNLNYYQLFKK